MVVRDLAGTFIRNLPGIIGDLVPPGATEITPFRRPIALGLQVGGSLRASISALEASSSSALARNQRMMASRSASDTLTCS